MSSRFPSWAAATGTIRVARLAAGKLRLFCRRVHGNLKTTLGGPALGAWPGSSAGIIHRPHLDCRAPTPRRARRLRLPPVEQPGIDPHLAEILSQRPPVGAAAAGRAMVDADAAIPPH